MASVGEELVGAEDFSYVLQRVPGTMVFLGARPPEEDPATAPGNHSNKVVFHEPALAVGAAMYAAVASSTSPAADRGWCRRGGPR